MGANRYFYVLLATSLVTLVGLTQLFTKTSTLLYANAIHLCQKTLSNINITLSSSLPITIIGMILFILLIGVVAISIQALKTRRFIAKNLSKKIVVNRKLRTLFRNLYLENKVDVVADDSLLSFSYGLFAPRVCLSTGLIQSLTTKELKAVLLHESYHLKNLDPLKIVLSKTASCMFFFLPIIYDFQRNYELSKEIAADNVAITYGQKNSLIAVLTKLLTFTPNIRFSGLAALADIDTLEARILHMTEQNTPTTIRILKRHVVFSLAVAFLSIFILNTPVHALAKGSMVMNDENNMSTFCVCPFGDNCMLNRTQDKKSQDTNASKNILYTPIK